MKTNQNFVQFRFHQGDIQGRSVPSLPKGAVRIENKPIALGEMSGHLHAITGDVELFEFEGTIYAAIGSDGATLQHTHESHFSGKVNAPWQMKGLLPVADHQPIVLQPKQVIEVWIQNAYNPYAEMFERVVD